MQFKENEQADIYRKQVSELQKRSDEIIENMRDIGEYNGMKFDTGIGVFDLDGIFEGKKVADNIQSETDPSIKIMTDEYLGVKRISTFKDGKIQTIDIYRNDGKIDHFKYDLKDSDFPYIRALDCEGIEKAGQEPTKAKEVYYKISGDFGYETDYEKIKSEDGTDLRHVSESFLFSKTGPRGHHLKSYAKDCSGTPLNLDMFNPYRKCSLKVECMDGMPNIIYKDFEFIPQDKYNGEIKSSEVFYFGSMDGIEKGQELTNENNPLNFFALNLKQNGKGKGSRSTSAVYGIEKGSDKPSIKENVRW